MIFYTASQSTPVEFALPPTDSAFYYLLSPLVGYLLNTLLSLNSPVYQTYTRQNASSTTSCRPYPCAQRPEPPYRRPCSPGGRSPAASGASLDCCPPTTAAHARPSSAECRPRPLRPDGFHRRVSRLYTRSAILIVSRQNPGSNFLPENRALTFSQRCCNRLLRRPRHWRSFQRRWFQCPR